MLSKYYNNFQAMVDTINDDGYESVYYTAMWLTSTRILLETFDELNDMKSIEIVYDQNGGIKYNYSLYIEKEPFMKYRLDFQRLRKANDEKKFKKD